MRTSCAESNTAALAPHLTLRLAEFPSAEDGQPLLDVGPPRAKSYWNVIPASEIQRRNLNVNPLPAHVLSVATIDPNTGNWHTQSSGTDRVIMGPFDFTLAKNARVHLTHHVQTSMGAPEPRASIEYYCVAFCDGGSPHAWTRVHDDAQWATRGNPQPGSGYWVEDGFRMEDVPGSVVYLALTFNHDNTANGQPGWLVQNVSVMEERGYSGWSTLYENRLDYNTREYDAIVVGTGVEQRNLDDHPEANADWHGAFIGGWDGWSRAGGDLVVLGSNFADPQWLMRGNVDVDVVDTRTVVLDEEGSDYSHPLLSRPHAVNPRQLDYHASGLALAPGSDQSIAVRVHEGNPEADRAALTISNISYPGRSGGIVLTAVAPQAEWMESSEDRTRFLVNAFAALAFQHHDVAAGTEIPRETLVASSSRVVLVDGTSEQIPYNTARATLWVWQ